MADMDSNPYKEHTEMWQSFVRLVTWGTLAVVAALALMAFFLL